MPRDGSRTLGNRIRYVERNGSGKDVTNCYGPGRFPKHISGMEEEGDTTYKRSEL